MESEFELGPNGYHTGRSKVAFDFRTTTTFTISSYTYARGSLRTLFPKAAVLQQHNRPGEVTRGCFRGEIIWTAEMDDVRFEGCKLNEIKEGVVVSIQLHSLCADAEIFCKD